MQKAHFARIKMITFVESIEMGINYKCQIILAIKWIIAIDKLVCMSMKDIHFVNGSRRKLSTDISVQINCQEKNDELLPMEI